MKIRHLRLIVPALFAVACASPPKDKARDAISQYAEAAPGIAAAYEASGPSAPPAGPGRKEYAEAKEAIWNNDLPRAMALLTEAVRLDPTVCEYWYQLGAAESNRAIDVVNDSQTDAIKLFESSVDHKTEALRLINLGQCPIWTEQERAQAKYDAEMALQDAEAVLADKTSLVQAMQMYAAQRQR